eukprot:scaffold265593_cov31-Tisochrysis_lutea.AAC.3
MRWGVLVAAALYSAQAAPLLSQTQELDLGDVHEVIRESTGAILRQQHEATEEIAWHGDELLKMPTTAANNTAALAFTSSAAARLFELVRVRLSVKSGAQECCVIHSTHHTPIPDRRWMDLPCSRPLQRIAFDARSSCRLVGVYTAKTPTCVAAQTSINASNIFCIFPLLAADDVRDDSL